MCTQKAPFKTEPLNNAVFANSEARSHIDASQNAQEHKTILEPTQEKKLLTQPPVSSPISQPSKVLVVVFDCLFSRHVAVL